MTSATDPHPPAVQLVKGFYDRLFEDGSTNFGPQGGRVTLVGKERRQVVANPHLSPHDLHHTRLVDQANQASGIPDRGPGSCGFRSRQCGSS